MKITSLTNKKVAYWAKLKMKKYRDIEHLFIIEKKHLVDEAIKKGIVKEIITTEKAEYDLPVFEVSEEIMKRLTSLVSAPSVMAVCSYILPSDISGNVLILDKIQDPGNLGTMIRSAIAFNFETIILSKDSVDMYNDKVIRSSEGMFFHINIIRDDLHDSIKLLKDKGYMIVGTDIKNGYKARDYKNQKCAIVIGNEGSGISLEIKELCDYFINIKISEKCESLNAAVAASIIMGEVFNG